MNALDTHAWSPRALGLGLALALTAPGCGGDGGGAASAITATPGTALHHAQTCQAALGRIPTWACKDGVEIPIHVDGVRVGATPETCDDKDLKGACIVGSYVGELTGTNLDGTPKPDVNWVYFCRRDDDFAQMIGHDTATGATCFFELQNGYMPLVDGVPEGKVPGLDDPDYEKAWKRPEAIAIQECNSCHSPDPFIHTPFVDAARRPNAPERPVVPMVATPDSPYFVVGDAFAAWTFDYVEFDDNACTTCHRMPDFTRFTFGSGVDFNAHMPPLDPGSMKADYDAVVECLERGPDAAPGCAWAALDGAEPAGDPGKKTYVGEATFSTTYGTLGAADPFAAGQATLSITGIVVDDTTSLAGPAPGAADSTQFDVIGHLTVPDVASGVLFVARFIVPTDAFAPGATLSTQSGTLDSSLVVQDPSKEETFAIGELLEGTLTLTRAGTGAGAPVEGSFLVTWQGVSDKN